ncbi:integrase [Yersinia intermedia]|nr:integrase [Yersinia intermedia]
MFSTQRHIDRSFARAASIHKAEHLDERRLMLQWWPDFLDANREKGVSPFDFGKLSRCCFLGLFNQS